MKLAKLVILAALVGCPNLASAAQSGQAQGPGATTGDPASSSASSSHSSTTGFAKPSASGSGTSTSGGSDANGDQGRDKMPGSNKSVMPLDQQHKPDNGK